MGLSCRLFLVDENDVLYRLSNAKFDQMLRRPAEHRFPRFAGARVRMASVIVGLEDRKPIRVVRTNFSILSFDKKLFRLAGRTPALARTKPNRARTPRPRLRLPSSTQANARPNCEQQ
jgi:hypothetical protein